MNWIDGEHKQWGLQLPQAVGAAMHSGLKQLRTENKRRLGPVAHHADSAALGESPDLCLELLDR